MGTALRTLLAAALAAGVAATAASAGEAPPRPVTDFVAKPAGDVGNAAEAWAKARELEWAVTRPARERLCEALPYYLFVVRFVGAEGKRDANASAAALRIAEIVESYAAFDAERLVAGKFYLVSAFLDPGSDAWQRAEGPFRKAGQGEQLSGSLVKLAELATRRAEALAGSASAEDLAKAALLKDAAGRMKQLAESLRQKASAEQPAAPTEFGGWDTSALPAAPPRLSGWVELRDNVYVQEHRYVKADDVKRCILHLEGQMPVREALVLVSGEYVGDFAASDNDGLAEPVEAYVDAQFGDWDVRVGQQIFSWGSGLLFNPTDNVGRWNSSDPFHAQRRGVPAALVRYNWGASSLEGAVISGFEATRLPQPGDRFFIYSPAEVANPFYPLMGPPELATEFVAEDFSAKPGGLFETEQCAFRLRTTMGTWDLALSYFRGYENIPVMSARAKSIDLAAGTTDLEVEYYYPREQVVGVDLAGTVGNLGLHAEAARFDMKSVGTDVGVGDRDYISYVAGVSYPFEDIYETHDLLVSLEYAGEIKDEEDERIYINRIYQDSVLARLKYTVDYRLSFELQEFFNLHNKGSRTYLGADYRWSDYVAMTVGADMFSGPADTFFGAYDYNDRLFLAFKVSF